MSSLAIGGSFSVIENDFKKLYSCLASKTQFLAIELSPPMPDCFVAKFSHEISAEVEPIS